MREFGPMRMFGVGLAMVLACGASPRRDLPTGPSGAERVLVDAGFRMSWPWTERRLNADGLRTDEHLLRGGSCLAVVIPDEQVEIEAGGVTGLQAHGASWLVGCIAQDGPIQVTLRGPPGALPVVGMFVGPPEAHGHTLLAEHFQVASPPAEQPASTLQIQDNACEEDEARDHYRRGMELARTDELEEASEALALAYACHADGTILFNLATVTARRGRASEAREMFTQLLRDHPRIPDTLRDEVEAAFDRLLRPGTLRIRVEAGDALFVNGVRVPFEGQVAVVEAVPGQHVVSVRSAPGVRHELTVRLRASQELEIDPRHRVQSTAESE